MRLNNLRNSKGSRHRPKRVGRGPGSGHGGTSCRGHKGERARVGNKTSIGFEGGQMPLIRRIPKRGFNQPFKKVYNVVNLDILQERFNDGEKVNYSVLQSKGIIKKKLPVKILGDGKIEKKLNIKADAFSKTAIKKIKKAGGSIIGD